MKPTRVQLAALKSLRDHGSEGVRTNRMTMLARGAELGHGPDGEGDRDEGHDFFAWTSTWAALVRGGFLEEVAPRRFRITDLGRAAMTVTA